MPKLSLSQNSLLVVFGVIIIFANVALLRLLYVLQQSRWRKVPRRPKPPSGNPTHLLVVLGSGGHTAEMLNMLEQLPQLTSQYLHRTYVVSSGDAFSASKAAEFEEHLHHVLPKRATPSGPKGYTIITILRARKVHQSLLTTPWNAMQCLFACFQILQGTHADQRTTPFGYPDLILSNGPGTAVCVVLAAVILRCFGLGREGQLRTIFVESWARVKSISLSGKILLPLVDRFLVQWPQLHGKGGRAEYIGTLIS